MSYVEIAKNGKTARVSYEPKGFGEPYKDLHEQTSISLYFMAKAEGSDNFDNPLARSMEAVCQQQQLKWYGLITRDVVEEGGKGVDDKGRLHLKVTAFDGIEGWEKTGEVWAPKSGYLVPTDDSDGTFAELFHEGTPVPKETLPFEKRDEAIARWKAKGLDSFVE